MASSRRTRRRRQQQSLRRHRFKLESLEKRYALDGDGLSISMNADYVTAGTTFPTDYGPGALANSGAPTNFFLPQGDLTPSSCIAAARLPSLKRLILPPSPNECGVSVWSITYEPTD